MQSWGTRSRFIYRDTETEPSKSGVLGLVAAAMGRPRGADLSDLAALSMGVRIDRPGHLEVDYQTALHVIRADGSKNDMAVQSWRHYLADASFLVGLMGPAGLCEDIRAALRAPRWPLFLGRKGFVPGAVVCPRPVQLGELLEVLSRVDWPMGEDGTPVAGLDAVVDCGPDESGDLRQDVPVSFAIEARRYRTRLVRRLRLSPAQELVAAATVKAELSDMEVL